MRILPIHRWQGGLLGCCVSEWLPLPHSESLSITRNRQIGQHLMKDLIEKRQLSEQDWLNLYQRYSDQLKTSRSGDLIVALLPLILLYHDSRRDLEQQLSLVQMLWQQQGETIKDVAVWAYLASLVLREQLQPQQWLDRVIQFAQTRQTPLAELLKLVKRLLEDAVPLHQGIRQIIRVGNPKQLAFALSIYCFGSTPDHLQLSLLRASQIQEQSSLILALTGFLSGIYNSISGFPLAWRIAAQNFSPTRSFNQQAVQLFAVWSGAYQPNTDDPLLMLPLAASGVIQRRTSLSIVSQDRFEK